MSNVSCDGVESMRDHLHRIERIENIGQFFGVPYLIILAGNFLVGWSGG
ncbi:hypothetical protein ACXYL9_10290 [Qipengyuania sp. CAU 1752]